MKQALILFSGGKDSFLATLLMIEKGYKVNLVTYENGCGLMLQNSLHGAKRILKKYGDEKVNIIGIQKIESIFREFLYPYYNLTTSEIKKEYGEVPISQFNCLSCRVAMYVMSIILCKKYNIKTVVDGARKSQLFAIEQPEVLAKFKDLFNSYGLDILFPLENIEDNYEIKNELLIRGFVSKTLESQCLLGMPLKDTDINKDIIQSTVNVYERLIEPKAKKLIDKYKDIDIVGEYF